MSFDINDQKNIGGKRIQGGFPANLQFIRFNFANNQWEYVLQTPGETNLGANVGAGVGLVFRDKTGVTLNFKTLIAGAGITIVNGADDITISVAAVAGLGDLEFLRDKQLAGDLIVATGTTLAAAPVTVTSIIPASGKTFFIANSNYVHEGGGTTDETETQLQNDGVVKDIKRTTLANARDLFIDGVVIGDSLVGDGAKIYRIQKTVGLAATNTSGTILGWIQDT